MNDLAIQTEHLSKTYSLALTRARHDTLRDQLVATSRRLLAWPPSRSPRHTSIRALHDVSFAIRHGEAVGIIGRNGAGKSTLLKILSRITDPTTGSATIHGRLASLLEVGTGFHPELTGRENAYLNGAILGMTRAEIDRKFADIIAFAEIDRFVDTPVKRYSSGMYVRLAFAVAAHLEPDILLLDEVLSVGDLAFQRKCMTLTQRLRERQKTILLVSHNMFAVKSMCTRVIYLSAGSIVFDGPPDEAIQRYEHDSRAPVASFSSPPTLSHPDAHPVTISTTELLDESGQPRTVFDHGERLRIRLYFEAVRKVPNPNFTIAFIRSDNVACCNFNTATDDFRLPPLSGPGVIELLTPPLKLVAEHYTLQILVWDTHFQHLHGLSAGASFHVRHHLYSTHFGVFHESGSWSFPALSADPASWPTTNGDTIDD